MTVSNPNDARRSYTGNGVTVAFAGPPAVEKTDLVVRLQTIATGVVGDPLDLNIDYAITGDDVMDSNQVRSDTTVTMTTAPSAAQKLLIDRDPPDTQLLQYPEGGRFPARSHAEALDLTVMRLQAMRASIARVVRVNDGESAGFALAAPGSRASTVLGFDADGEPIYLTPEQNFTAAVRFDIDQALNETQKGRARSNIEAERAGRTDIRDYEAADGNADDTAEIAAALTAGAGGEVFVPEGTFIVTGLTIPANTTLRLSNGAIIKRKAASTTSPLIALSAGATIEGPGTIDGNRSNCTGNLDTVKANGVADPRVVGVKVINPVGDGWSLNMSGDRCKVVACHVEGGTRGIQALNCRWTDIKQNTIKDVLGFGVRADGTVEEYGEQLDISDNTFQSSGGIVVECFQTDTWFGNVADGTGLTFAASPPSEDTHYYDNARYYYRGVRIVGNKMYALPTYGIIARSADVTIQNNVIVGCAYSGIVPQARHVSIGGNVVRECVSVGVDLGNCAWGTCLGNHIDDCDDIGIEINSTSFFIVKGNVLRRCAVNGRAPILLANDGFFTLYDKGKNTTIEGNTIYCIDENEAAILVSADTGELDGNVIGHNKIVPSASPAMGWAPLLLEGTAAGDAAALLISGFINETGKILFGSDPDDPALYIDPDSKNVGFGGTLFPLGAGQDIGTASNPINRLYLDADGSIDFGNNDMRLSCIGNGVELTGGNFGLGGTFYPITDGAHELGIAGGTPKRFTALRLTQTGVIDFGGDMSLTGTADNLVFAGGNVGFDGVVFSQGGTGTLGNAAAPWPSMFLAQTGFIDFGNNDMRITGIGNALEISGGNLGLGGTFYPITDAAYELGVAGGTPKRFTALRLTQTAVLDFGGDMSITGSADNLTFAGGNFLFGGVLAPSVGHTHDLGTGAALPWRQVHASTAGGFYCGNVKVLGAQGAAVADATDAPSAITQLNLVLARLRAHGAIATS